MLEINVPQAGKPIGYEKGDEFQAEDTLAVALGARVREALGGGNSEPMRCSACRAAGRHVTLNSRYLQIDGVD